MQHFESGSGKKKKTRLALFQAISLTVYKISTKDHQHYMCYIDIILDACSGEE